MPVFALGVSAGRIQRRVTRPSHPWDSMAHMFGAVIHGAHDVRYESRDTPALSGPESAVVRVVATCVCGSDLWSYRGQREVSSPTPIGHEFIGLVESVGEDVHRVHPGDLVIAPFYGCDNTCVNCRNGVSTSCLRHHWWNGTQAEYVGVPMADGTLVPVPGMGADADSAILADLLTLSDVMGTGLHAALSAGVTAGSTVAVVGDGAVGLCAILASSWLGASRIVAMSRHPDRQQLAREFGATDVVAQRGPEGIQAVIDLCGGIGPDAALECVGTEAAMTQALGTVRPGGVVGYVGVPVGGSGDGVHLAKMFYRNVGIRGGVAPVRGYIERLLPDVLAGKIHPGRVFTETLPLAHVADAYRHMDERTAIKVMLRP